LTLGRDHALSEVLDPVACDPEAEGEPEALLASPAARWSMATEWARVGPSLVIRLILVVPTDAENRVKALLEDSGKSEENGYLPEHAKCVEIHIRWEAPWMLD